MTTKERSNFDIFHAIALISILLIFAFKLYYKSDNKGSKIGNTQSEVISK